MHIGRLRKAFAGFRNLRIRTVYGAVTRSIPRLTSACFSAPRLPWQACVASCPLILRDIITSCDEGQR
ncbi:hypothetical protein [Rhizobium leguminosarum]